VTATFDAKQYVVVTCELNARDHIGTAEAAHDGGGFSIDHGVPDGSGLLIASVVGLEHRPSEPRP
jgi:hypothetical protein